MYCNSVRNLVWLLANTELTLHQNKQMHWIQFDNTRKAAWYLIANKLPLLCFLVSWSTRLLVCYLVIGLSFIHSLPSQHTGKQSSPLFVHTSPPPHTHTLTTIHTSWIFQCCSLALVNFPLSHASMQAWNNEHWTDRQKLKRLEVTLQNYILTY